MSSARSSSSSAALVGGAIVGVVTMYLIVSLCSSRKDGDEVEDFRNDNKDGFEAGDSCMNDRLPPKGPQETTSGDSTPTNDNRSAKDPSARTLTLADIIISDPATSTSSAQAAVPDPMSLPPPLPAQSSLPRMLSKSYSMDGIATDMFVQVFSDRIVVGVSQLKGKFGNYLMCQAIPDEVNPKHVEYDVTTLLGSREDTLLTVYARQITEQIEKLQTNPTALVVIVAISLHKSKAAQPEMFSSIVNLIVNLYRQASAA